MIRFHSIYGKNFRRIKEIRVNYDNTLPVKVMVVGPNGSGKTTFVNLFSYALYGRARNIMGERKSTNAISTSCTGKEMFESEIVVSNNNAKYRILRTQDVSGKGTVTIYEGDREMTEFSSDKTAANKFITDNILPSEIFDLIVYHSPETSFLKWADAKIKEFFFSLKSLGKYSEMRDKVAVAQSADHDDLNKIISEIEHISKTVLDVEGDIENQIERKREEKRLYEEKKEQAETDLVSLSKEKGELEGTIKDFESRVGSVETERAKVDGEVDKAINKIKEIREKTEKISEEEKEVSLKVFAEIEERFSGKIGILRQKIESLGRERDMLVKSIRDKRDSISEWFRDTTEQINKRFSVILEQKKEKVISDAKVLADGVLSEIKELEGKLESLTEKITLKRELEKKILSMKEDRCPTCEQILEKEKHKKIKDSIEKEIAVVDAAISKLGVSSETEVREKIKTLEEQVEKYRVDTRGELSKISNAVNEEREKELNNLSAERCRRDMELEPEEKKVEQYKSEEAELKEEVQKEEKEKEEKIRLEREARDKRIEEKKEEFSGLLETMRKERDSFVERGKLLSEELREIEIKISDARERRDVVIQKIANCNSVISTPPPTGTDDRIKELKEKISALEEQKVSGNKRAEKIRREMEILEFWSKGLKEIPNMILDATMNKFNELLSKISLEISGGTIDVELSNVKELKSGEGREKFVFLIKNNRTKTVNEPSRGELACASTALFIAINELIYEEYGIQNNVMFFDEAFDSLDDENSLNCFNVICSFLSKFNVYIMTHSELWKEKQSEFDLVDLFESTW